MSTATTPQNAPAIGEVLSAAADLLEKPGAWTQGEYARDAQGNLTSSERSEAVSFCMAGAIYRILGGFRASLSAYERLLGFHNSGKMLNWNDAEGRTQAEVVAALRLAAHRARAGEL